jgi:hypothetical protein
MSRSRPQIFSRFTLGSFGGFWASGHHRRATGRPAQVSQINIGFVLSFWCVGGAPRSLGAGRVRRRAGGATTSDMATMSIIRIVTPGALRLPGSRMIGPLCPARLMSRSIRGRLPSPHTLQALSLLSIIIRRAAVVAQNFAYSSDFGGMGPRPFFAVRSSSQFAVRSSQFFAVRSSQFAVPRSSQFAVRSSQPSAGSIGPSTGVGVQGDRRRSGS